MDAGAVVYYRVHSARFAGHIVAALTRIPNLWAWDREVEVLLYIRDLSDVVVRTYALAYKATVVYYMIPYEVALQRLPTGVASALPDKARSGPGHRSPETKSNR